MRLPLDANSNDPKDGLGVLAAQCPSTMLWIAAKVSSLVSSCRENDHPGRRLTPPNRQQLTYRSGWAGSTHELFDGVPNESVEQFWFDHVSVDERRDALQRDEQDDPDSNLDVTKDPHIPATAQPGNELYSGNRLEREHLAKRTDLAWGTMDETQQGNLDSFYYTNITQQMDDFNQPRQQGLWG